MQTCVHYFAELFEWEMFQTKFVEKIKTHVLCLITFFPRKSWRVWDNVEKYGRAGHASDDNITRRMRFAFVFFFNIFLSPNSKEQSPS